MLLLLREDRECLRIFQSATQTVASFELPVFGSMTSDPLANRPVSGRFRRTEAPSRSMITKLIMVRLLLLSAKCQHGFHSIFFAAEDPRRAHDAGSLCGPAISAALFVGKSLASSAFWAANRGSPCSSSIRKGLSTRHTALRRHSRSGYSASPPSEPRDFRIRTSLAPAVARRTADRPAARMLAPCTWAGVGMPARSASVR